MSRKSQNSRKPLAIAAGSVLVGGLALTGAGFAMTELDGGYMQSQDATAQQKPAEGKCGEGKCAAGQCGAQMQPKHGEGGCGIAMMDTNKDGRVDKAEFAKAHGGKTDEFPMVDADGNGYVTQAEIDAHHAAMGKTHDKSGMEGSCGEGKCGAQMMAPKDGPAQGQCGMAMADADKDGRVSRAEFARAHEAMFKKIDSNGDGFISAAEMQAHRASMHPAPAKSDAEGKCGEGKCGAEMTAPKDARPAGKR